MFSAVEENYLKGLISSYYKKGYKFYVCHTITENNNEYDVAVYFSKNEIVASTPLTFDISNGVYIKIDSSSRYSYNDSSNIYKSLLVDGNYNNILSVDKAEFIYTNAKTTYAETSLPINPDINYNTSNSYSNIYSYSIIICLITVLFLYIFIRDLLRFGRK